MRSRNHALPIALAIVMSLAAVGAHAQGQNVVIHLSKFTDSLHAPFMALKIGKMLAQGGAKVTLFVDQEAVRMAWARQALDLKWGQAEAPLLSFWSDFVEAGGKVLVCPHCAKAAGVTEVRTGAKLATEAEMAKLFLEADKVIDY